MVQTIDITRAMAISGWMTEPELVWLAQRAREHSVIVEIGSYLGRSTRAMLDHTQGIVYAVDDWKGPRDVYMSKEEREGLYQKFCQNVCDAAANLKIIRTDHSFPNLDLHPDFVFIDGSHEYEDIKRDILFWKDKLTPGGLLCGHDADWTGVATAVNEVLGDDIEIADNTRIWWVKL